METNEKTRLAQMLAVEEAARQPEEVLAEGGAPMAAVEEAVPGAGAVSRDEQEALLRGLGAETTELLRQLTQRPDSAQEEAERNEMFRQLYQQGLALQERTPGFDLNQEMKNPQFVKLVHPKVGLDVETAFRVAHFKELEPLLMRYAAQQAAGQLAQSVATGQMRPPENGATQEAVQVNEDPRLWSREQREAIRERVRRGERVVL